MIGKLLGHTQVQTTARYAHLARDTVKASAARIGDTFSYGFVPPGLFAQIKARFLELARANKSRSVRR